MSALGVLHIDAPALCRLMKPRSILHTLALSAVSGLAGLTLGLVPAPAYAQLAAEIHCNKSGDAAACYQAALLYALSDQGSQDDARATDLMTRACDLGDASSCSAAANRLFLGASFTAEDVARGVQLVVQGCWTGGPEACRRAGFFYAHGYGVDVDHTRSTELFAQGCWERDALSCLNAGENYAQGIGVGADPARAVDLFVRGCQETDAVSCRNAGLIYAEGHGAVAQNLTRATTLFVSACDQGDGISCHMAGLHYDKGLGVPIDHSYAAQLAELACTLGHQEACDMQE